jgi:hypothetical protein
MTETRYVERDKDGKIVATFRSHQGRDLEEIAEDHPDLVEFRENRFKVPSNIPEKPEDGAPVRV